MRVQGSSAAAGWHHLRVQQLVHDRSVATTVCNVQSGVSRAVAHVQQGWQQLQQLGYDTCQARAGSGVQAGVAAVVAHATRCGSTGPLEHLVKQLFRCRSRLFRSPRD
jgi:hypothetical protein